MPRLAGAGHDMAISAFYGLHGARISWNGIPVYPGGTHPHGSDVLGGHAKHSGADLVITLMDIWALDPDLLAAMDVPVAHWMPVDTGPLHPGSGRRGLSALDEQSLKASGATPVAMSRHGETQLAAAGFKPLYVPHGIDTQKVFTPAADRAGVRAKFGVPADAFVVGINAANSDQVRKGFPEQFAAFADLHARHPDTVLLVHTLAKGDLSGVDLSVFAHEEGIGDAVRFTAPYAYRAGTHTAADMANWYRCLDLYSGCTYGEGFGLPIIEAQACGVPVVVTDCSAMSELCGAGWRVYGEPFRNPAHRAWWRKPQIAGIGAVYEDAYNGTGMPAPGQAREFALRYDADYVLTEWWKPCLETIESAM